MKLEIPGIVDDQAIPERFCFGIPASDGPMQLGENRNPAIHWSDLPEGTRSLVLICVDPDVPSVADDVNQEGKSIAKDLPRVDFYHWLMVDIDPGLGEIREGSCSEGVTAGGKDSPPGPTGSRQGLNDYTGFMAGNPDMEGQYFGYDGPCPPWNDERPHRYRFRLIATSLPRLNVDDAFRGPDVEAAIKGHVLGEASITGWYSLNPAVSDPPAGD
ncbi:YbhB/YbcL family Raf kinase inhibitor-like protein [Natronospira bacteriovora]|uniref:YbhB/YbcL family Raf kinase inhibitor-like protein n=1 Tax=Natronospira bacteriovora TaxID=3069753 RepID=A0ABU0W9B5_9GAMM|nr:YbhB/YbcL family Raf kinase inhibitor-like protein [Natronospira sp. AB-CW4]MDQ2070627.1 YbhB/YbcL family Raf kinase inhibitor-like protein [Natronospira sp. AB-CW4]